MILACHIFNFDRDPSRFAYLPSSYFHNFFIFAFGCIYGNIANVTILAHKYFTRH
jgi:hypothetical protein